MYNIAKYIIVENGQGVECPIVFSQFIVHVTMARGFPRVISAGFVQFKAELTHMSPGGYQEHYDVSCDCYGESVSLRLKSRGIEDDKLIEKFILNKD